MKTIYLILIVLLLSVPVYGGYDPGQYEDTQQQQMTMPSPNVVIVSESKHWYYEIIIGIGTLVLGAVGLWLKYRK